jgi:predicted AAA+ superfamily ATPase
MNYLASNGAKMHSFASLGKICGIRHPETIKNYLSFLEETYLISTIYKYSPSLKVQMASPKKVYLIDNALMSRIGFNPTYNLGPLLENLVFLELRRRGHQVFYHSSKYECDFVIQQGSHIPAIYQVSVDITDSRTLHREIDGLLDAAREYSPEHRYILTLSDERVIQNDEQTIEILPVWKWLLNKDAF